MRVGIVGMGNMGCTHFAAYEKARGATVVAFSARSPKRLAGDVADLWGNLGGERPSRLPMERLRAFDDHAALVRSAEVDAVSICTPTATHASLVREALRAGKHVLCEKPLCRTAAEAAALAAESESSSRVLMPGMVVRFFAAYEWLTEAVRSGRFGRVRAAHFSRIGAMPPGWFADGRASGGALLDLHLHDIDMACALFGPPASVTSRGFRGRSGEIDHVHTQYAFSGHDAVVTAEGSWAMAPGFPFRARFVVAFEHAAADYDMGREPELLVYRDGGHEAVDTGGATGHEREIAHFVACCADGVRPRVGAREAALAIRVAEAEAESVETGERIRL